ncbi:MULTISPECIES: RNA recognition motif domain-containing protein [Leptolyngbya]|jgi:RNA recognition motif-containing protein|uniref:RNA-binding protein n=2 Tax=Leptolyngbya boryana TaxID=1184 RepID=A0A1Z4JCI5_LEPBY|nr:MULTISPECIES: RNA-binding protein [Leptolyngbya]BAY54462.1 RNA-binding protein [Leptolyngbya boryana NIES-2135]MBD1856781.1 RNA-binding protein [Leptolyngbya sp. FACHB-1624]MBD2365457.1 RNA-binding protein [Leptolyngbya sp. FACHB-161]MBD2371637.1 RNA-binding protein [Leptolyngbya sp. FACHB-238]MBD2396062.1 RNA-binding protein [Leptolyngbya sp. FACHB-239]
MSVRLYVGNLPEDLSRQDLEAAFADAGEGVTAKLITDRKTGKCRGFGFVTVKTDELADQFIEKYNGVSIKDNAIKIEKALPRTKDKADEPEAAASNAGGSSAKRSKGGNNNNKARRSTTPAGDSDSVQPDPRWAQELEKLKQMLATQATNS